MSGTPHRPRAGGNRGAETRTWDAQATLNDLAAELIAERVYASVDALAAALQVKLGTLSGATVGASGPAVPTTTVRSHCDRVFEGLP